MSERFDTTDLLNCYRRGVFPMADSRDDMRLFLMDPDLRGVLPLDRFHVPARLRKTVRNEAGDFIYIEPGVPHEVTNLSDTEPVMAVVARSDASEWENIVEYDRNSE